MDPNNSYWDLGFRAGIESQAMLIADLTKKLNALTGGAPLILQADLDRVNKEAAFLKRAVSNQCAVITRLVEERDANRG